MWRTRRRVDAGGQMKAVFAASLFFPVSERLAGRNFFLPRIEIAAPLFEAARGYCRPHLSHQAEIVVEVVHCVKTIGKEFAADIEVAQVCAGEAAACVAAAMRVKRTRVLGVCVVLYVNGTARGEHGP